LQADSSAPVTLRTRKFITNRLLSRRQFVLDVLHPSRPNVSKSDLQEKLATLYKADKNRVVLFGFRTHFGGGKSTGFALIYDDEASQKKFEPKYRLIRVGSSSACRPRSSSCILRAVLNPRLKGPPASYGTKGKTARKRLVIYRLLILVAHTVRVSGSGNQEVQGCRATQEGKIVASCRYRALHFISCSITYRLSASATTVAKLYIWRMSLYPLPHGSYAHTNNLKVFH